MNAYEIIESANYDLDHNKITLGEWEKRIEPTKNVKPIVYGKWKRNEISLYYKCSNCKESAVMFPYQYCPLCGAEMTNYAKW